MPIELFAAAQLLASSPSEEALNQTALRHESFSPSTAAIRALGTGDSTRTNTSPVLDPSPLSGLSTRTLAGYTADATTHPFPFEINQSSAPVTLPSLNGEILFSAGAASHRELSITRDDLFVRVGGYQSLMNPSAMPLALQGEVGARTALGGIGFGELTGTVSYGQTLTFDPQAAEYSGHSMNAGIQYRMAHSGAELTLSSLVCGATGEMRELVRFTGHHDLISDLKTGLGLTFGSRALLGVAAGGDGVRVTPQLQFSASTEDHKLAIVLNGGYQFGGRESSALDHVPREGAFVSLSIRSDF